MKINMFNHIYADKFELKEDNIYDISQQIHLKNEMLNFINNLD